MKLLWNGTWLDVPCYSVPEAGTLVRVEAARPLVPIVNASGRVLEHPYLKAWRFLLRDGPANTFRKARTKYEQDRYLGDYHVAAVLGTRDDDGRRVIALACRVPPAADYLVVHRDLVVPVDTGPGPALLQRVAATLGARKELLASLGRQTYLYSGQPPPADLVGAVRSAIAEAEGPAAPDVADDAVIVPPGGSPREGALRLEGGPEPRAGQVALLGAGDYARTEVIPAFKRAGLDPAVVADLEPHVAATVGARHGFRVATTDAHFAIEQLDAPGIVVVATAHDSHAALAAHALRRGHRVFLEKPAVVTADDLELLLGALRDASDATLELGFNRRSNPLAQAARQALARDSGPFTITCVVKEVPLELDHWYLWPTQGTRVTGNLCHWIDLAVYLMGTPAVPETVGVSPRLSPDPRFVDQERALTITFDDGSLVTIVATDRGDATLGVQEKIEARRGDTTVMLDDLAAMEVLVRGRRRRTRTLWRDKGHSRMFSAAFARLRDGAASPYPLRDLAVVSAIQIEASAAVGSYDGTRRQIGAAARRWLARAADDPSRDEFGRPNASAYSQPG